MASEARTFAVALTARLVASVPTDTLIGVYLHGSAVLGDWNSRSDVDVLVIASDALDRPQAEALSAVLADSDDCPGAGVEASVVTGRWARAPRAPWPYVVHVTTNPFDRKTVWGGPGAGDRDLILHYLVTRARGVALTGPSPLGVIGGVGDDVVIAQLADELRWGIAHAPEQYAVLNACRALRFCSDGMVCSKTEGGQWALKQGIQPPIVRRALDARVRGEYTPAADDTAEWVLGVADQLSSSRSRRL